MKAIEILKELKQKDIWDRQRTYLPSDETLDEALAELEALQSKDCEECHRKTTIALDMAEAGRKNLQALQTKLQSLEAYCKTMKEDCWACGCTEKEEAYQDILTKLRGNND